MADSSTGASPIPGTSDPTQLTVGQGANGTIVPSGLAGGANPDGNAPSPIGPSAPTTPTTPNTTPAPAFTPPPSTTPMPVNQTGSQTPLNLGSTIPNPQTQSNQADAMVAGADTTSTNVQDTIDALTPAPTALDQQNQAILSSITQLTGEEGQKGADTAAAMQQAGVPKLQTTLQNLNNQLTTLTASYNKQFTELGGGPGGLETSAVQNAQSAGLKAAQAADIGLVTAQISAAQGNLTLAQQQVTDAINLKYSTIDAQLQTQQAQLAELQPLLTKEQTVQAAAMQATIAAQVATTAYNRDQAKQVGSLMISYPNVGITSSDSVVQASQKISQYLSTHPNVGGSPVVTGSYYDTLGNKIDIYSIMGSDGVLRPINSPTSPLGGSGSGNGGPAVGNMNLGMATGNMFGMPTYNTLDNNPGVPRPIRNNNPGDIEATATSVKMPGVIGIDPGINGTPPMLIFAPGAGVTALSNMISTSPLYSGLTAEQAINLYITGNPNKEGSYTAADLGLNPNQDFQTQLKDQNVLQTVVSGITQGEGGGSSSSTSTTTPNTPTFEEYGLLANSNFNPNDTTDKIAAQYLDAYIKNGAVPSARSIGLTTGANLSAFATRARDLYFQATGQPLPNPAQISNAQTILNTNNTMANNLKVQEQTVASNVDLSLSNLKNNDLNSTAFKPLNDLINTIQDAFNNPATGQLLAQNTTIQNELGSLLAVKNASGTTVFDKLASAGIIESGDNQAQVEAKVNALLQEAGNFSSAIASANAAQYLITDPLMQNPSNPFRAQYQQAIQAGVSPQDIMTYLQEIYK